MTVTLTTGPGTLVFGAPGSEQEFSAQMTSVTIEPDVDAEDDIPVLSGAVVAGEETETFVLSGSFLQDITLTGITTWTWNNSGTVVPFVFIPNTVTDRQVSGEVKVRKTTIGGDVKAKATADFEFPGVGEPVLGDVV